ncbi:MAG: hypothetical protein ACR2JB_11620 [Bryobacteraceae bacterium]
MTRADWIILALSCAKSRTLSPVQLQKSLFLLGKELPEEVGSDYYRFVAHNYGPFDRAIYSDASVLSAGGFVAILPAPGRRYSTYSLTPMGVNYSEALTQAAPSRALAYLVRVVEWVQGRSFADLLRSVYARYPEYRANSVFQE